MYAKSIIIGEGIYMTQISNLIAFFTSSSAHQSTFNIIFLININQREKNVISINYRKEA